MESLGLVFILVIDDKFLNIFAFENLNTLEFGVFLRFCVVLHRFEDVCTAGAIVSVVVVVGAIGWVVVFEREFKCVTKIALQVCNVNHSRVIGNFFPCQGVVVIVYHHNWLIFVSLSCVRLRCVNNLDLEMLALLRQNSVVNEKVTHCV